MIESGGTLVEILGNSRDMVSANPRSKRGENTKSRN